MTNYIGNTSRKLE